VSIGSAWTAEAWFKYPLTSTGASWSTLYRSSVDDHQVIVNRGDMQLGMYDNATSGGFRGTGFIMSTLSNGWHHLSAVGAGGVQNFYVDGKYVGQTDRQSTSDIKAIGNYQGGGQNWGYVDNVLLFNYARTPAQVAWDFDRGKPVGWWKMDEGEGDKIYDSSGNGKTGTLTQMDPPNDWVAGKFGKALDFDGSDDYSVIDSYPSASLDNSLTVSFWFNVASNTGNGRWMTNIGNYRPGIYLNGLTPAIYYVGATGLPASNEYIDWAQTISTGDWHFTTFKFWPDPNHSGKKAWQWQIDGKTMSGDNADLPSPSARQSVFGNASAPFNGQLDDIRLYNYALSDQQVNQAMNNGSAIRFGE